MLFKVYCRSFQFIMRLAAYALPWRKPFLIEGEGAVQCLPERIRKRNIQNVLLVTDEGIMSLGLADQILQDLKNSGITVAIYDKTVPNPTIDNIEDALDIYHENNCSGIIALGGGSAMDCAKGVGARIARPKTSIRQMKGLLKVLLRLPPIFAVPTTAGTGSEATVAAVVVDSKTKEKYALMDPALIPHEAILDPLLTTKLPPHITATTGMDTLTHAVEAYIGRSNTRQTRRLAKETVKLVFENLYTAYLDGENIKARTNMQRAAYYGGIAFTRAYVGNVHALAHALGGRLGIAHGLANAVILPYVLDDYGTCVHNQLSQLADVVGISGKDTHTKAKNFIASIRKLNNSMNIPTTLDSINEEDISELADHAFREANPTYPVPRIFSREDFASICHRLTGKTALPGYEGKMAHIDLSTGEVTPFMLQKDELTNYIGGKGLAAKIIYDAFDEKVDAFSEENLIVITTAPLNASSAPSSSRFNISTISPLTGLLVSSNCGGDFGLSLRKAGYDALVIRGIAPKKAFIRIDDNDIRLLDAKDMWGLSTSKAQDMMGSGGKLVIGVAGENLVRYACVANHDRVAGRGGVGAVFGYKQLKGIVADSNPVVSTVPRSDTFKDFNKGWITHLRNHPLTGHQLPTFGTAALVSMMQYNNLLATKNYSSGKFSKFDDISGETLKEKHLVKTKGCKGCPIRCGRVVMFDGQETKGPELETLVLLGSNLLNNDMDSIVRLNHLCDEYGIDTISFGGTVGFAMELSEKGLWENGLKFGNCSKLEELLRKVATREGIGNELAEGVMRLSEKYGGREFAIHVKGMELAAYDPRAAQGMGLGYATANRGGCHLNGGYMVVMEGLGLRMNGTTTRGKAAFTVFFQDLMEAASSAGSCLFTTYAMLPAAIVKYPNNFLVRAITAMLPNFGGLVRLLHNHPGLLGLNVPGMLPHPYALKLVTGTNMNIGRFVRTGERIYNIERLVNIRQGLKDADTLPDRLKSPLQKNMDHGVVALDKMLKKYYSIRGWDSHGAPKKWRLKKLGLR